MASSAPQTSFLATRRGKLMLALLCAVAFLDFIDASITNIALPSIRRDLHFSVADLQWIPSGYLLTYGGFMLGAIVRLIPADRGRARLANFDALGALLVTGGMLLLVFALVKAPTVGWDKARTIAELAGALALLVAFVANEVRSRNPLAPL